MTMKIETMSAKCWKMNNCKRYVESTSVSGRGYEEEEQQEEEEES